jgi:hypothetical protein
MGKHWFDDRGYTLDGQPEWVGAAPTDILVRCMGRGFSVDDRRSASAFNTILLASGVADAEVVIRYRVQRLHAGAFSNGGVGIYFRYGGGGSNFYAMWVGSLTSYSQGLFRSRVGGVNTDATITGLFTGAATGVWRNLRLSVIGSEIKFRAWEGAEPSTWNGSWTNTALADAGDVRLVLPYAHGHLTEIEYVAVGTDGDEVPATPPHSVSGVVRDASGSMAVRAVKVIRRDTGRLLGSANSEGDGSYVVPVSYSGEIDRVILDDDAGDLRNDLIDRVFPV